MSLPPLILSIIMPVFNESGTVDKTIQRVLSKEVPNCSIQLIIVESNSSDGTREIVESFRDNPKVKIVLQNQARGKGNAVRSGIEVADGDIILIQDADDEYDIDDYDVVLEPILKGHADFVLGSRHSDDSGWKMRVFDDQPIKAFVLNCGHLFFTFLVNILYGLKLRDPFTMYKVFRRSCIANMSFVCDRFDFDYELLIKLVRRGYIPIEVPIQYHSRSFSEGKKIRIFFDPITWIYALIRFRFGPKP